jgi:hypothetical protein
MAPAAPHVCRSAGASARDTALCAAAEPWHGTHGGKGGALAPLAKAWLHATALGGRRRRLSL